MLVGSCIYWKSERERERERRICVIIFLSCKDRMCVTENNIANNIYIELFAYVKEYRIAILGMYASQYCVCFVSLLTLFTE